MMKIAISNPHDRFFKELFSREGKSFIVNYLPREILNLIDPDSAELVKDSFTDSELGEYFSDMIYKVRLKDGSTAHIYILFEHKSYSDPMAGFQILCYMVRIWEKIIRNHEEAKKAARKEGKKLPDEPPFRLPPHPSGADLPQKIPVECPGEFCFAV
jgi:predicted transposase/invertase (TIGR01784 family)